MSEQSINEQVYEQLGWKVIDLNDNPHGVRVKGPNWVLTRYEGIASYPMGYGFTLADALRDGPDYTGDLRLAIQLIDMSGFTLNRCDESWPGKWEACIDLANGVDAFTEYDDNPARAICKAWLAWKGSQP